MQQSPSEEEAYFAPISATYLQWTPWFRLDRPNTMRDERPRIAIDGKAKQVVVTADSGVAWIGFFAGPDIDAHRVFEEDQPQKVTLSFKEIEQLLAGREFTAVKMISAKGYSSLAGLGE